MDFERENKIKIKQFWSNKINNVDKYPPKNQQQDKYVFPRHNNDLGISNATDQSSEMSSIADLYDLNRQNRQYLNNHFSSSNLQLFANSQNITHRVHHQIKPRQRQFSDFEAMCQAGFENIIDDFSGSTQTHQINNLRPHRVHRIRVNPKGNQKQKQNISNQKKSKSKKINIVSNSVNTVQSRVFKHAQQIEALNKSKSDQQICCCNIFQNPFNIFKTENTIPESKKQNKQTLTKPFDQQNNKTKSLEIRDRKVSNISNNDTKINLKLVNQKHQKHKKSLSACNNRLNNHQRFSEYMKRDQNHIIQHNIRSINKQIQQQPTLINSSKHDNIEQYIKMSFKANYKNQQKINYYKSTIKKEKVPTISQFQL